MGIILGAAIGFLFGLYWLDQPNYALIVGALIGYSQQSALDKVTKSIGDAFKSFRNKTISTESPAGDVEQGEADGDTPIEGEHEPYNKAIAAETISKAFRNARAGSTSTGPMSPETFDQSAFEGGEEQPAPRETDPETASLNSLHHDRERE